MKSALRVLALAAATVVTWYAWLGHDTEYQVDAAGVQSGPYTTVQVAGCVLTLLAVLVAAVLLRIRPLVAAATMTVAFTVAWTVPAAAADDSGLFVVGMILVLGAMAAGTSVVAVATDAIRRPGPR